jgi:hypothetical protein
VVNRPTSVALREAQARIRALLGGLQQLGWTEGRNLRIDYRFGAADVDRARRYAVELMALAPDVIQASGTGPVPAVHEVTRTVTVVFVKSRIRLTLASSTAWRGRAATPPDSPRSNMA